MAIVLYLCDTVMDIYDFGNSKFDYKSVHMEDIGHHNTDSKEIPKNM